MKRRTENWLLVSFLFLGVGLFLVGERQSQFGRHHIRTVFGVHVLADYYTTNRFVIVTKDEPTLTPPYYKTVAVTNELWKVWSIYK